MTLFHLDDPLGSLALSSVEEVTDHFRYVHYMFVAAAIFLYYSRFQEEQILLRDLVNKWNQHKWNQPKNCKKTVWDSYWIEHRYTERGRAGDMWIKPPYAGRGDVDLLFTYPVFKYYKRIVEILGKPPAWRTEEYCRRAVWEIAKHQKLSLSICNCANQHLERFMESRQVRYTNGLAAACIYLACQENGFKVTRKELAGLAGCTAATVRNNIKLLSNVLRIAHPNEENRGRRITARVTSGES